MDFNEIQFQSKTYGSGAGHVSGFVGDKRVSHLGWDSTHTIQQMETHPDMRRQGIMARTWDAGVQQAGYLRHSPGRTDLGNKFAQKQVKESGKKLPRRQSTPEYNSSLEWD